MEEKSLRQGLQAYVADEPPSTLNLAATLSAGRRARRRRLIACVTGTAAGVLAVIAIVATTLPTPFVRGAGPAGQGTSGSPHTTGPHATGLTPCPSKPPATDTINRITCYLTEAVTAQLPDATFTNIYPDTRPLEAQGGPVERPTEMLTRQERDDKTIKMEFKAYATITDAQGSGSIWFSIFYGTQADKTALTLPCTEAGRKAHCWTGPEGQTIRAETMELPLKIVDPMQFRLHGSDADGDGGIQNQVTVFAGHTQIMAFATYFQMNWRETSPVPRRSTSPPDLDQLTAIATAPELRIYD